MWFLDLLLGDEDDKPKEDADLDEDEKQTTKDGFDFWNFEEEELEEDDYYCEDDDE